MLNNFDSLVGDRCLTIYFVFQTPDKTASDLYMLRIGHWIQKEKDNEVNLTTKKKFH